MISIIKNGIKELLFANDQLSRPTGAPQKWKPTKVTSFLNLFNKSRRCGKTQMHLAFSFPSDIWHHVTYSWAGQEVGVGVGGPVQRFVNIFLVIKSCYQAWDMDQWVRASL